MTNTITYKLNGRCIGRARALAIVTDTYKANGYINALSNFIAASEQDTIGYVCRDAIEETCEGLTIRHSNEEQS